MEKLRTQQEYEQQTFTYVVRGTFAIDTSYVYHIVNMYFIEISFSIIAATLPRSNSNALFYRTNFAYCQICRVRRVADVAAYTSIVHCYTYTQMHQSQPRQSIPVSEERSIMDMFDISITHFIIVKFNFLPSAQCSTVVLISFQFQQ